MNDEYEYRLSWQSVPSHYAAGREMADGRDVWQSLTDAEWDALPWLESISKIDTNPWDQYNTLLRWSEGHEQPQRNVTLERRIPPNPDEGWEVYERPADAARRVTNALMRGTVKGSDLAPTRRAPTYGHGHLFPGSR